MRDISVHIFDVIENSVRFNASKVVLTIDKAGGNGQFKVIVEDNGAGLDLPFEKAFAPFYSTNEGKRIGLGLNSLRLDAEKSGGKLTLSKSALGGLKVEAVMYKNANPEPLSNLASILSSIVCTNPDLDLVCNIRWGKEDCSFRLADVISNLPPLKRYGLTIAREVTEKIKKSLNGSKI
jgi:hypothetical protein